MKGESRSSANCTFEPLQFDEFVWLVVVGLFGRHYRDNPPPDDDDTQS